ncbi:uncharacterized protein MELLADRAFT_75350 [Melampsora larici-populina 98AG31]|uniref:NADPH-dependent diflavin oxidoreductase 1 n=1 Tax=Melampsora larici-populina (strain 98AG31 / pathotype 3-4-7) TaxID=747676 RepID=F4RWM4_MELLP|nr:uncharacterized protein MELLADRAFT_75350 [Melampsora larici-populina 98AG31]EGG03207.1 hypothetical protein MELLADRAFT_75350 [Melampsora larici-populina 98AG31]
MNQDIKSTRPPITILYGSQTGTAEDLSHQVSQRLQRLQLKTNVSSIDDFHPDSIFSSTPTSCSYIIFIVSTTGQGVEPTNMKRFWKSLLQKTLPFDLFENVMSFTVFGLGDSSYPKFNWSSKKLYRRLLQLGAHEFFKRGEADDQNTNGIDTTFTPWLDQLCTTLLELIPLPPGLEVIPETQLLPARYTLKPIQDPPSSFTDPSSDFSSTFARLSKNERLTPDDHWQETRHLEFDFDERLEFLPGWVASVLPENSAEEVNQLLKLMKWEEIADELYELKSTIKGQSLPDSWNKPCTLRELFTTRFDFLSVPKKSFISWISYFAQNQDQSERLKEFCTIEAQDDLYDYINRPKRTILEVLQDFKSVEIPLDYLHDIFPIIRPRQFSIASSPKIFPNQIHLLVAVVKYQTRIVKARKGLCTSWLSKLKPGYFTFSSVDPQSPVICIGPGTGIAPFRSLIQHRSSEPQLQHPYQDLVFFGFRNLEKDCYYREEWMRYQTEGNCKVVLVASRDQVEKKYVQHEIENNSEEIWKMIFKDQASIFISGSAGQMPKSVRKALRNVFEKEGKMKEDEVDGLIERLEKTGRLQEETWN